MHVASSGIPGDHSAFCEQKYADSPAIRLSSNHSEGDFKRLTTNIHPVDMNKTFAVLQKEFKCRCFCGSRSEIKGFSPDSGDVYGFLKELGGCAPKNVLKDNDGKPKYLIKGEYCQCGFCCRNTICCKNSEVLFGVYKTETDEDMEVDFENKVGLLKKSQDSFLIQLFTDADTLEMEFPPNLSKEEKLMFIGNLICIDYRFFETSNTIWHDLFNAAKKKAEDEAKDEAKKEYKDLKNDVKKDFKREFN